MYNFLFSQMIHVVTILLLLLILQFNLQVKSHECITESHILQPYELVRELNIEMKWGNLSNIYLPGSNEASVVKVKHIEPIVEYLNKSLVGNTKFYSFALSGYNQIDNPLNVTKSVMLIVDSSDKQHSSSMLKLFDSPVENWISLDLLRSFARFIDCRSECKTVIKSEQMLDGKTYEEYDFKPSEYLTQFRLAQVIVMGSVKLKINLADNNDTKQSAPVIVDSSKKPTRSCETICSKIQLAYDQNETTVQNNNESLLDTLFHKIYSGLVACVSILDPHHWLILVLGTWLTTCLVIAVLIKRRDKRRLRLHLQERADYSFSTRR